ncbi:hypothetical protein AAHB65_04655 [Bacillus toyonensis]
MLNAQLWTVVAFMIGHQVYFKVKINRIAYDKNKKGCQLHDILFILDKKRYVYDSENCYF